MISSILYGVFAGVLYFLPIWAMIIYFGGKALLGFMGVHIVFFTCVLLGFLTKAAIKKKMREKRVAEERIRRKTGTSIVKDNPPKPVPVGTKITPVQTFSPDPVRTVVVPKVQKETQPRRVNMIAPVRTPSRKRTAIRTAQSSVGEAIHKESIVKKIPLGQVAADNRQKDFGLFGEKYYDEQKG